MMTSREFFETVIATVENEELKEYAHHSLTKLNEKNSKESKKREERRIADAPLLEKLEEILKETAKMTSGEIALALDLKTSTGTPNYSKATVLAKRLVEQGKVKVTEEHFKNKGTLKVYSLVQ